jgi:4-hydroxyphenylpyruvate dioxygenase
MGELGTDLMLVCSNVSPEALGGIDRAAAISRELGERAAKRGLRVGFEALAWGRHVSDHRDAWEIVRRADHPNVGPDPRQSFHTLARKIDPDTIRAIPGDRIFFVQLADAPLIDMDLLYWSRHFRNMPGEGDLRRHRVHARGRGDRLCGPAVARDLQRPVPRRLAPDHRRRRPSLAPLPDGPVRRAEPGIAIPCRRCRTASRSGRRVHRVRRRRGEAGARRLLRHLGFRDAPAATSPRTSTLWRQGGINIVVNTERKASPIPPTSCTARTPMRSA